MTASPRVLLFELLDASGASPSDARARAQVLREAGANVRLVVFRREGAEDLQHGIDELRPQAGIELVGGADAAHAAAACARQSRADLVLWASAAPGGGPHAHAILPGATWWWPTGFAASSAPYGPLHALDASLDAVGGSVLDVESLQRPRLSLWDGPYALVASPLSAADARAAFASFAKAVSERDDLDLVVLDHPSDTLDTLARAAGVAQRVHCVGAPPREAEVAWLQNTRAALVGLHRPVSSGLVLRALAAGCPVLPLGEHVATLATWLEARGLSWAPTGSHRVGAALETVLQRGDAVERALAHGRALARGFDQQALAARCAPAISALLAHRRDKAA